MKFEEDRIEVLKIKMKSQSYSTFHLIRKDCLDGTFQDHDHKTLVECGELKYYHQCGQHHHPMVDMKST